MNKSDLIKSDVKLVTRIKIMVSRETGIKISDIDSMNRQKPIAIARQISMYLCRWNVKKMSMLEIAKLHGKVNHATVINADTTISNILSTEPNLIIRGFPKISITEIIHRIQKKI